MDRGHRNVITIWIYSQHCLTPILPALLWSLKQKSRREPAFCLSETKLFRGGGRAGGGAAAGRRVHRGGLAGLRGGARARRAAAGRRGRRAAIRRGVRGRGRRVRGAARRVGRLFL